jgi:hypothetical protein
LFIAGTVPNRALLPVPEETLENGELNSLPSHSPTPLSQTWQDGEQPAEKKTSSGIRPPDAETGSVTVMICPITGLRATVNCPDKYAKTFRAGTEPKEFCTFHK